MTKAKATGRLQVEYRALSDLVPYLGNSRTHTEDQVRQIAASITEFGFTNPVLIDELGRIIAGHGRVLAAQQLGMDQVPTITLAGLTDAQKRAYVIADNKLSLNSNWDFELLASEIAQLKGEEFDVMLLGFSEGELMNITLERAEGDTNPDDEWKGMPEYRDQNKESFRRIIVHFKDAGAVKEFAKAIGRTFTPKTNSIWFPDLPRNDEEGRRYGE